MLCSLVGHAQSADYTYLNAEILSPSSVKVTLRTFAKKKKLADFEANCAALRIIMFDGLAGTIYKRPLLKEGTIALRTYSTYFEELFNNRMSDVIKRTTMESKFKEAEKGENSTLYTVEVNYIQLKKDLEHHKIRKELGL